MKEGSTFESSWELYEPMSFIKSQFKTLLVANGEVDNSDYYDNDVFIEDNPVVDEDCKIEEIIVDIDVKNDYEDIDDSDSEEIGTIEDSDVDSDSAIILTEMDAPPAKNIKLSHGYTLDNYENKEDASSDHLFIKSLIPFMMQMTNTQKLRVRNTIQNVILHELQNNWKFVEKIIKL